jgi:uncharacterized protein (DUF1800 family)
VDNREKVAHLYRRFGLGATPEELDEAVKAGYDRTLEKLVRFDGNEPAAAPAEFFWREKEEADLGAWRVRCWWVYRMLTTKRPLQEKLALFWHNHFAVSDNKVEDGPMMLDYLEILEHHAGGKFLDILRAVSQSPAMMRYLDMSRSVRGNPNENFAREVMELFTLGIGNYTEDDVKEAARALTGWGYVHTFWELPGNSDDKLKDSLKYGRPFSSFAWMPALHDPSPKKILGKESEFDGEGLLVVLADHPATARHICRKLWEFFAYPNPEDGVVDRLVKTFHRSKGDISEVMLAIGRSREFQSDKALRAIVKSPVDLCIPIARQMGVGDTIAATRPVSATMNDRISQKMLDVCGGMAWIMEQQGLSLLYPPDVSGWKWNEAWATPDAMGHRFLYRGMLLWGEKGPDSSTKRIVAYIQSQSPKEGSDIAAAVLRLFDIQLGDEQKALVVKLWVDAGGTKVLENMETSTWLIDRTLALTMASPAAHLC